MWPLISFAAARRVARKPLAAAAGVTFSALAVGNAHNVRSVAETGAVGRTSGDLALGSLAAPSGRWLSGALAIPNSRPISAAGRPRVFGDNACSDRRPHSSMVSFGTGVARVSTPFPPFLLSSSYPRPFAAPAAACVADSGRCTPTSSRRRRVEENFVASGRAAPGCVAAAAAAATVTVSAESATPCAAVGGGRPEAAPALPPPAAGAAETPLGGA